MNSAATLALSTLLLSHLSIAYDQLPVNPGGIGGLFRGPNSETIIRGPDGSQITSEQIGAQIKLDPIIVPDYEPQLQEVTHNVPLQQVGPPAGSLQHVNVPSIPLQHLTAPEVALQHVPAPEVAVHHVPAPEVALPHVLAPEITVQNIAVPEIPLQQVSAPIPLNPAPELNIQNEDPHIIETEFVDAPEIEPEQSSDLKGPSGTISVRGSSSIVSGPASTTISEPLRKVPILQPLPPVLVHSPPPSPPSQPLVPAQVPLLSLGGTSGAGIADAASSGPISATLPPTLILSSTPQPHQINVPVSISSSSPHPNIIQHIEIPASSTLRPLLPLSPSSSVISSTVRPIQSTTFIPSSSTVAPNHLDIPPGTLVSSQSGEIDVNRINLGVSPQITPVGVNNQLGSYTSIDGRDIISPVSRLVPHDKRHWLNIEPVQGNNVVPGVRQNLEPIASVLDTVLVQPTDPKNREVIEFQGKQLENVGNIVPVLRNPVIVSGNLNEFREIPTGSISQLSARTQLDPNIYGRYQRDAKTKN